VLYRLIVATLRADVQGGVSHSAMWLKARNPLHGMGFQFFRTTGKPSDFILSGDDKLESLTS
jgi:hypothetical protein